MQKGKEKKKAKESMENGEVIQIDIEDSVKDEGKRRRRYAIYACEIEENMQEDIERETLGRDTKTKEEKLKRYICSAIP